MKDQPGPEATNAPHPGVAPRRRWLRLSLRGLMVLVLIAGGCVGWLAYTIRTQRAAIRAVEAAGGKVWSNHLLDRADPADSWTTRARRNAQSGLEAVISPDLFLTVKQVDFRGAVDGAGLAYLAGLRGLEGLDFGNSTQIGAGWDHLRRLSSLKTIELNGPGQDDTNLQAVAGLRSLAVLGLTDPEATDAGYAAVATMPALTDLNLAWCRNLTAQGAAQLGAGLPALRSLSVLNLSAEAVDALLGALPRHHPDLAKLGLIQIRLTDADLAALARLTRLKSLTLVNVPLQDAGLEQLGSLAALTDLDFKYAGVTDAGLRFLGRFPTLRSLGLHGSDISDAGLAQLRGLPIVNLKLTNLPDVTDAGMAEIAQLQRVETLEFYELHQLTDAGLIPLRRLPNLKTLTIGSASGVTAAGAAALRQARPDVIVNYTAYDAFNAPPMRTPRSRRKLP